MDTRYAANQLMQKTMIRKGLERSFNYRSFVPDKVNMTTAT